MSLPSESGSYIFEICRCPTCLPEFRRSKGRLYVVMMYYGIKIDKLLSNSFYT